MNEQTWGNPTPNTSAEELVALINHLVETMPTVIVWLHDLVPEGSMMIPGPNAPKLDFFNMTTIYKEHMHLNVVLTVYANPADWPKLKAQLDRQGMQWRLGKELWAKWREEHGGETSYAEEMVDVIVQAKNEEKQKNAERTNPTDNPDNTAGAGERADTAEE